MAEVLDLNTINRLIDEELTEAKAKYGPRHFDIIVLESSRGDTIGDVKLLTALRHLSTLASSGRLVTDAKFCDGPWRVGFEPDPAAGH